MSEIRSPFLPAEVPPKPSPPNLRTAMTEAFDGGPRREAEVTEHCRKCFDGLVDATRMVLGKPVQERFTCPDCNGTTRRTRPASSSESAVAIEPEELPASDANTRRCQVAFSKDQCVLRIDHEQHRTESGWTWYANRPDEANEAINRLTAQSANYRAEREAARDDAQQAKEEALKLRRETEIAHGEAAAIREYVELTKRSWGNDAGFAAQFPHLETALTSNMGRGLLNELMVRRTASEELESAKAAHLATQAEAAALREALVAARDEFKAYQTTHAYHWTKSWTDSLDKVLGVVEASLAGSAKAEPLNHAASCGAHDGRRCDCGKPDPSIPAQPQPDVAKARQLLDGFEAEVESASRHLATKDKGGMQVPFHGDFAGVPPSRIGRLRWWAKAFREAIGGGQ